MNSRKWPDISGKKSDKIFMDRHSSINMDFPVHRECGKILIMHYTREDRRK
jgi:hypothetical protein